jgi:hypothetical protein
VTVQRTPSLTLAQSRRAYDEELGPGAPVRRHETVVEAFVSVIIGTHGHKDGFIPDIGSSKQDVDGIGHH